MICCCSGFVCHLWKVTLILVCNRLLNFIYQFFIIIIIIISLFSLKGLVCFMHLHSICAFSCAISSFFHYLSEMIHSYLIQFIQVLTFQAGIDFYCFSVNKSSSIQYSFFLQVEEPSSIQCKEWFKVNISYQVPVSKVSI